MATAEQMQQMINLMQQQMDTVKELQEENARLRNENGEQVTGGEGPSSQTTRYSAKKPDRPVVNASIDARDWALFVDGWTRYKQMCRLKDDDVDNIRLELRACCSSEVNKLLFEYVGSTKLTACSEAELLGHIKAIAVKIIHKEVYRMAFNCMTQDQGETVTKWVARLKAKAILCQFEVPCTCCTPAKSISYAEEEISQRLIAGLRNQEHTQKILSEAETLVTLDQKEKRLQVLEATDETAYSLQQHQHTTSDAAAGKSAYKLKKAAPGETGESAEKCRWCGLPSHPGGKPIEKKSCPAKDKKCAKCQKKGHFARVCEQSDAAAGAQSDGSDGNPEQLPTLPAEASVSFSFGATQPDFCMERDTTGGS